MVRNFDLLVFDWDGTLLDSISAIVNAIKAACRDLGLPEPADDSARHVIGLGLSEALCRAVPDLSSDRYPEMVERYRHHYLSHDADLQLFDGVAELIGDLTAAGHMLAIATGKSRLGLTRSLEHCGLGKYFLATRCADDCFSKPHPQMLEELMAEFTARPEKTLMIGDTSHDLQMALNAGVSALAVSYGAHPAGELNALSPLACLKGVGELAEWLKANA